MSAKRLSKYVVCGHKIVDGKKQTHKEYFTNGRDAYIIESWLKREGYSDVTIKIV